MRALFSNFLCNHPPDPRETERGAGGGLTDLRPSSCRRAATRRKSSTASPSSYSASRSSRSHALARASRPSFASASAARPRALTSLRSSRRSSSTGTPPSLARSSSTELDAAGSAAVTIIMAAGCGDVGTAASRSRKPRWKRKGLQQLLWSQRAAT